MGKERRAVNPERVRQRFNREFKLEAVQIKGVVFEYFFETVLLGYAINRNYSNSPLSR